MHATGPGSLSDWGTRALLSWEPKDVGGLSLPVSGITDARACYAITNASACSKTNPVAYNSVHASRPRSVADWCARCLLRWKSGGARGNRGRNTLHVRVSFRFPSGLVAAATACHLFLCIFHQMIATCLRSVWLKHVSLEGPSDGAHGTVIVRTHRNTHAQAPTRTHTQKQRSHAYVHTHTRAQHTHKQTRTNRDEHRYTHCKCVRTVPGHVVLDSRNAR